MTTKSTDRPVVPPSAARSWLRLLIPGVVAIAVLVGFTSASEPDAASVGWDGLTELQVTTSTSHSNAALVDGPPAPSGTKSATEVGEVGLADLVSELPPTPIGFPPADRGRPEAVPVGLSIPNLGIDAAPVIAVGVEDNGEMEIPPADEVGWYRYGQAPGEPGATVLAAHVAFDGRDGVFIRLDEASVGDVVTVALDDGSTAEYAVTTVRRFPKDGLPDEELFAREGREVLVLITCGGEFNRSERSYDDNIVVTAEVIGPGR